ncbi:ShlB/FhaC/HecB family hemolysin secretion/activation protein [uncultured Selenomonas sp.]|uniref:ShlB/FhaC/HecB family hemolysin secretion/activation protein n=1 Tax=uncultured Selenomonas sp. TaxID=159275 RepID=UPI0025EDA229|nr:ShlB/FhaC/HecB family hemolysin secretion/activation protein [uncultured Selenomonas sp.]
MGIRTLIKKQAGKLALGLALALCVGGIAVSDAEAAAANAAGAAAATANEFAKVNDAQAELFAQEKKIAERQQAQAEAVKDAKPGKAFAPVSSLVVKPDAALHMTETEVLRLVPEAKKPMVNIHKLSKEIQFINDGGAVKLNAAIQREAQGYLLTLTAEKVQEQHTTVTVSNTGNDYTGNWRVATSYVDRNLTHKADTLGVAYVTSPSAGHVSDVKQGAIAYRLPTGLDADAVVVTASYSDVDLGSIYHDSIFDTSADGKGFTAGLHYQHHQAYTSREKDGWDFGINYWNLKNKYNYYMSGRNVYAPEQKYDVTTGSIMFQHNDRDEHHSFSYQAGIETNLGHAGGDVFGSDKTFQLYKAGISYNYRTDNDWIFSVRGEGQYSKNDVLPALQIGAGGRASVRGFAERAIAADKGIVGTAEIYTPQFAQGSRFLVFCDAAQLSNNDAGRRDVMFDSKGIASWGIGYRYQAPNGRTSVAIDYADIIKDVDKDWHQQHKRWNIQFSVNF